jgi:uncharacterized protein (DUF302 family)
LQQRLTLGSIRWVIQTQEEGMRTTPWVIMLTLAMTSAMASDVEMISKKSPYSVVTTMDKLEATLKAKDVWVVARVNHAAAAKKVGMDMRDTELIIFGNPKLGTPLMINQQSTAMDLPLKILVWKDAAGQVWVGYDNPQALVKRHALAGQEEIIKKMQGALENFSNAAIAANK